MTVFPLSEGLTECGLRITDWGERCLMMWRRDKNTKWAGSQWNFFHHNIRLMTSKWRWKYWTTLACSEPANEKDPTNQTARPKRRFRLRPSLLLLPLRRRLSLPLPLSIPTLSQSLFAPTVLTSYHEDVSSHWNKGQVKSIKQWDSSSSSNNNWTHSSDMLPAGGVAVGVDKNPNTLEFRCPLNRWKNVNISYALWWCRAAGAEKKKQKEKEPLPVKIFQT